MKRLEGDTTMENNRPDDRIVQSPQANASPTLLMKTNAVVMFRAIHTWIKHRPLNIVPMLVVGTRIATGARSSTPRCLVVGICCFATTLTSTTTTTTKTRYIVSDLIDAMLTTSANIVNVRNDAVHDGDDHHHHPKRQRLSSSTSLPLCCNPKDIYWSIHTAINQFFL
jgi:hypothetical protein